MLYNYGPFARKIRLPNKKDDEAMIKLLCQLIPFEEDFTIQKATEVYFDNNKRSIIS